MEETGKENAEKAPGAGAPAAAPEACGAYCSALRWAKYAGIAAALVLLTLWAVSAVSAFRENRKRLERLGPLLAEVRAASLDFDTAAASPEKYSGKPVLWCVQNISEFEVYYNLDRARSLRVANYAEMVKTPSGKQLNCRDMILRFKGAGKLSSGGTVADVEFVEAM